MDKIKDLNNDLKDLINQYGNFSDNTKSMITDYLQKLDNINNSNTFSKFKQLCNETLNTINDISNDLLKDTMSTNSDNKEDCNKENCNTEECNTVCNDECHNADKKTTTVEKTPAEQLFNKYRHSESYKRLQEYKFINYIKEFVIKYISNYNDNNYETTDQLEKISFDGEKGILTVSFEDLPEISAIFENYDRNYTFINNLQNMVIKELGFDQATCNYSNTDNTYKILMYYYA